MTWLPFNSDKMIEVDIQTSYADGKNEVTFRCISSLLGDTARFCYLQGSNVLWVASPMDDDGVPIYPETNEEGATRCDKIRVVTDKKEVIEETVNGVLADLDEYIRSKKALSDMNPTPEIYVIPG